MITNVIIQDREFTYSNIPVMSICTLGVVLNILLLIAFIKDPLKCFRNSGTYLVMNLSVSDCLTCLILALYHTRKLGFYFIYCVGLWFTTASVLTITCISIDRLIMVAYPIKHHIFIEGKLMVLWITSIWIISSSIPTVQMLYPNRQNGMYLIGMSLIVFSAMLYTATYYKLKKQSKSLALRNSNESRAQEIRIIKEKRFLKTIIIIAAVAFICVVPAMILLQTHDEMGLRNGDLNFKILVKTCTFIFYTNFAVNPLIYIVRLPNYRKTFYFLYRKRIYYR